MRAQHRRGGWVDNSRVSESDPPVLLSVIVPTRGRASLRATFASVVDQLEPGDEVLVRCSRDEDFGHAARQNLMERARGTHLVFMDDDDQFARGALATMRRAAHHHPGRVVIFRMRYLDGVTIWREPVVSGRNVGTPMFLVPNVPGRLGRWENPEYPRMADFRFIADTIALQGEPIFREEVVAHIRSDRRPLMRAAKRAWAPVAAARYRLAPRTRLLRVLGRLPSG
jgi:glycosyltransferase involved in cell wall biosynthesis